MNPIGIRHREVGLKVLKLLRTCGIAGWFCILVLASGCKTQNPTPDPTNTIQPSVAPTGTPLEPTRTQTPFSTNTPAPSPTWTETATLTPTPDLAATAAHESTQEAAMMLEGIRQVLEEVYLSTDSGALAWSEIDPWPITATSYGTSIYEPIDEGSEYQSYVLHYDVTWQTTSGLAGCGLIFHSEKDLGRGKQYRFYAYRFSGLPYWTVELWNYGPNPIPAMGRGKINSAIYQENGSTNSYTLVVRDDVMTIYANGRRLSHVPISTLNKGRIAFFAFQESGETTCAYKNAWLWELERED